MIVASRMLGFVFLSFAALGATACGSVVTCPDGSCDGSAIGAANGKDGEGGAGGSSTTSGNDTGAGGSGTQAVLYPSGDGRVTLRLTTFGVSCAAPQAASPYSVCGWADIEIAFPVELLVDGALDTSLPEVTLYMTETIGDTAYPDTCGGSAAATTAGGGPFGQVAFADVASDAVLVTVSGFDGYVQQHVDGTYETPRCQ